MFPIKTFLLVVVGGNEVSSTSSVVELEIRGRFSWPSFDEDDELAVGKLEDELVSLTEISPDFQTTLFESRSDIR